MRQAIRLAPIAPAGVFVAVFLLYAPSFNSLFAVLDFNHLEAIRSTDAGTYFLRIFDPSNGGREVIGTGDLYRPTYYTVFWFEYQAFGTNPMPYYIFNAALHAANAVLVFLLAKRLTKSTLAAVTGALLWGFHPQYADAVAWVSSTTDLLLVFFGLSAVLCYAKALELDGRGRLGLLAASFGAALLALGAKETGALVGPLIVGYHLLIGDPNLLRKRRIPWSALPFLTIPLVYFPMRMAMVGNLAAEGGNELFGWSVFESIHTLASIGASPVIGVGVSTWEFGVAQGSAGVALMALVALTLVLGSRREWYLVGWFLLTISTVVIFPQVWLIGRYLYLPMVGLAVIAGIGFERVLQRIPMPRVDVVRPALATAALAGLMVWFGWLNVGHQSTWKGYGDEARAFLDGLEASYPEVPPGGRIIVTEHPRSLSFAEGDGMMMLPAVRLTFGSDVDVTTPWHLERGAQAATEQDVWYPAMPDPVLLDASDVDP